MLIQAEKIDQIDISIHGYPIAYLEEIEPEIEEVKTYETGNPNEFKMRRIVIGNITIKLFT